MLIQRLFTPGLRCSLVYCLLFFPPWSGAHVAVCLRQISLDIICYEPQLVNLQQSNFCCASQGTCHQDLSSPPALPSGETCLPSWEPCCLSPPSRTTLPPSLSKIKKKTKLSSCLPADLCQHLGSALASAPSCPNPGHVHCLLSVPHSAHSSITNSNSPHVSKSTSAFDPFANQYLTVVPCLPTCPSPTLTDSHLATPGLLPPCRLGLKRCLLTLDLALLFSKTPILQPGSIFSRAQEKAFMKDLHASSFGFARNDFSFDPATTTFKPGDATATSYPIFSTKSFPSYTTISPSTFNGASKSSAWLNHRQNLKAAKDLTRFGKQAEGKSFPSLSSTKAAKNSRHHRLELIASKSGSNSKFALPKRTSKVGHKEAAAGFLQDLPEDDLVTVLEALKEAIDEVDVD